VRSNDVAASHGARIEKLDPKKLFYLQSKGIDPQEAKRLMLEGFVEQMLSIMRHSE
jgi:Fe-S cluster assembly protein SufD